MSGIRCLGLIILWVAGVANVTQAAVFDAVYEGGAYDLAIEYDKPSDPPLKPDDAKWGNKLLRAAGLH